MSNYILGAVGPSGGPNLCNELTSEYWQSEFPDICTTKSATCAHTPVFSYIYPGIDSILIKPLDTPGFYESFNANNPNESTGCGIGSTSGNVDYRPLDTGTLENANPGSIPFFNFFVNYGVSITLSFSMRLAFTRSDFRACYNLGYLRIINANPDNRGTLYGDWFKNYPDRADVFTLYDCYDNPGIENIFTPYERDPYPDLTIYYADINSFLYAADIENYFCNPSNYCCSCFGDEATGPYCSGPCDNGNLYCECDVPDPGGGYYSSFPCYNNVPYVTLQGTYEYTCDVPCGVEIELVLFPALETGFSYFTSFKNGEKGFINLTYTTQNCET